MLSPSSSLFCHCFEPRPTLLPLLLLQACLLSADISLLRQRVLNTALMAGEAPTGVLVGACSLGGA